jgi:hypothetical protein
MSDDCGPSPASCEVESLARRVAYIMGDSSGAANALRELERKRMDGCVAWIELQTGVWIVGSLPPYERKEG